MNKKLAFGLCTLGLMTTAFSARAEAFMHNTHAEVAALKTDTSPHLILVAMAEPVERAVTAAKAAMAVTTVTAATTVATTATTTEMETVVPAAAVAITEMVVTAVTVEID